MKGLKLFLGIGLCVCVLNAFDGKVMSFAEEIKIDGKCDEWQDIKPVAVDMIGDVAASNDVDFENVWVVTDSENIYISYTCANSIDWNTEGWRYNMFFDVDNDLNTGYRGGDMNWALGADFLVQGATIFEFSGERQTLWNWENLGLQTYSVDGSQTEVKISRDSIKLGEKATIRTLLFGDNPEKSDFVPDEYTANAIIIEIAE